MARRWTAAAVMLALWFPPPQATVAAAEESVAWLDCTLSGVPGGPATRLLMMTVGDRVERAVVAPLGMAAADVSGLKSDGGCLSGQLVVGHDPIGNSKSVPRMVTRMPLRLDLTIEGGVVKGSFAGSWPHPKRVEQPVEVSGTVVGVVRDEARLRAENGLAPDAAWPSYVGPNQNFSSGPCAAPLVGDLNQARLVWASQFIGPPESGSQRYGACVGCPPAAGGASPLVWKGRVYQFRYQATPEPYQKFLDDQMAGPKAADWRQRMAAVGWTDAQMRRRWGILADEELLCLDAATGQTLWNAAWPGEGVNLYDHKCSLTNSTGVAADGKVFTFGAMGIVRCVEAETGKVLWRAEVPGYADFMKKFRDDALAKRNVHAPTRSFCHGLNASGGTIIAPDGIGACGLVGLDAATGKVLWREKTRVLGKCATPLAWSHEGRHYAIAANESGAITCIDAADGRVAWRFDQAGDNEYTPLLVGDLLIAHKLKREERKTAPRVDDPGGIHSAPGDNYGQVACWRLTPAGPEPVWEAPADWGAPANCPVGSASGDLVCFRGRYSYYLVKAAAGERVASSHLPVAVRWDEGHMLALPALFVLQPDSQHGQTKMFPFPAKPGATVGPTWLPPHPPATTYQVAMSHAWADGRLFIRGADALYCYDLRARR